MVIEKVILKFFDLHPKRSRKNFGNNFLSQN